MCKYSEKLVAWTDHELPNDEAADVERHVRHCPECRKCVETYKDVSRMLVAYCDAAIEGKTRHRFAHWAPVLASVAAAALVFLVLWPTSVKPAPVRPRVVAEIVSPTVLETVPKPVKKVHRRHVIASTKAQNANWALPEPAIQIAIPVEAMFPPGAVPQGITFIANLSMAADGSVQALRLQQ